MADAAPKSLAAIDINNLDKEWAGHPERVESVGKKVARLKRAAAEAKQKAKVARADLKEKIRSNPEDFGCDDGKKPSEARLEDLVELQPEHQTAVAEQIQAEYDHDLAKALLESLQHRKDGLKDMVYLWGQTYFARPTEKRNR
jgi:hypothetical protein